ncbi:MAG: YqgE/AlgH family protein [Sandaracinaceae bacterium]
MTSELAPGLLIAAPGLRCPFFHHTVVLLVEHDDSGSLGFVINRPSDTCLPELAEHLDVEVDGATSTEPIWVGGPVAQETGWVLFDPQTGETAVDRLQLDERVALSSSKELLEQLASEEGPGTFLVLIGYAGWGPGQLDEEFRQGSWISADLEADLLFDVPPEQRWLKALHRQGIDPSRVSVGMSVAEA